MASLCETSFFTELLSLLAVDTSFLACSPSNGFLRLRVWRLSGRVELSMCVHAHFYGLPSDTAPVVITAVTLAGCVGFACFISLPTVSVLLVLHIHSSRFYWILF